MMEQAEAIRFIKVHLAFLFNALFPPGRQPVIYQITPVCFYLNAFSLESQLKIRFTQHMHRYLFLWWRHSVRTTSPSILYLCLSLLGATTNLGNNTYSYFYHPCSLVAHPNTEILQHWAKGEECAGAFPAQPPHYCWNLACNVPPTWKKCPEVTPELKCRDLETRRGKKSFLSFRLKLISLVFHSYFPLSHPKELLDLPIPVRMCVQRPQAPHSVPGKSACLRSPLFPLAGSLEQPTAFNKELFVWSRARLDITRTSKKEVLKFPTAFVTGFLPGPPTVLSPCPNG